MGKADDCVHLTRGEVCACACVCVYSVLFLPECLYTCVQDCKRQTCSLHIILVYTCRQTSTKTLFICTKMNTQQADFHIFCCMCHTHVMTSEVEKSSVPSRPRRQSAFFLWRWCISPPQLSQQRHMQKKSPAIGIRTANSKPTAAHIRKPIS